MNESDGKCCRICLTTKLDDNIIDSISYMKVFIHLMSTKESKKLWLCMWCRTTLRRTQAIIKLALQSGEILNSQNKILAKSGLNSHHTLSYHDISHIDIPPESIENDEKQIIIFNIDNSLKEDNEILNVIENINEVYIENEFTNDNLNKTNIIEKSHQSIKDKEIQSHSNEIETNSILKHETEIDIETKKNRKLKHENETDRKLKIDNEISLNENKRELKLDELKFEVKYLNLEQQLNEIEIKKTKYKDMKYQCELCGVGFQTNDYFEEHKVRHTEVAGPCKCSICHLHFKNQLVLSQHLLAHRRQFTCTLCGMKVSKWSNCGVHRQKCGGIVVHVECEVCCKVFSDEHSLKVHKRIHNMKKKYTCEQCGRQFNTKQRLIIHSRSHSGEKPFACSQCSRGFTTQSNLKAHSSVHADANAHYCVECDTRYKTAKSLKRHLAECARHIRERTNMFSCKHCSKEFSTEKALQSHVVRHSVLQQVQCPHCEKTFSNKSNMNKHLKCIHRTIST